MDIRSASVLITGGSRGLGRALGRAFASNGARVVLVARGGRELDEAVEDLRRLGEVHGIAADIGDKSAIYPIAGQAAALVGPVDILIQNASTLGPVPLRLLMDTHCEDLERVLAVNLIGPFRLAKAVAGSMILRGRGLVVSITSDASVEAYPGWGSYSLSKAALDHMNRIFAAELQDTGVRFIGVDPGEMDTRMHADAVPDADPRTLERPERAAARILEIVRDSDRIASGARLVAANVEGLR